VNNITTVMLLLNLKSRLDLYRGEPDPQYDDTFAMIEQFDPEVLERLHIAVHRAQNAVSATLVQRTLKDLEDEDANNIL